MGNWTTVSGTAGLPPGAVTLTAATVIDESIVGGARQLQVALQYMPPSPIGSFLGVHVYAEIPDGSASARRVLGSFVAGTDETSLEFAGLDLWRVPYRAGDLYQAIVSVPTPDVPVTSRFYAVAYSALRDDPVVTAEKTNPSPSITLTLGPRLGVSGAEYAPNVVLTGPAVVTQVMVGGVMQTHVQVPFTPPAGDPRWCGVLSTVTYNDDDGNPQTNVNRVQASPSHNFFPTPSTVQTVPVRLFSYGDKGDASVNSYHFLVTPETTAMIGTEAGTIDIAKVIVDGLADTELEIREGPDGPVLGIKGVDLSKAIAGTFSTEFSTTDDAFQIHAVSMDKAKTGILEVGGVAAGGQRVSRLKVFDTSVVPQLIGWIGDDSAGSGFVGAWFKRILIGGANEHDTAHQIIADASGNISIPGALIVGAVSSAAIAGSATTAASASTVPGSGVTGNITAGGGTPTITKFAVLDGSNTEILWAGLMGSNYGIWAKNAWFGGSGPADAKIRCRADGVVQIDGSVIIGAVASATTAVSATTATTATSATTATTATTAGTATSALTAGTATSALTATSAITASTAANAGFASTTLGSGIQGDITAGGAAPTVTKFQVMDGSNNQILWAGYYAGNYGLWGKSIWAGGTGPSDAPFRVDSTGKLSIAMTSGNAGGTPFQLTLNNVVTAIGNTLLGSGGYYQGLKVADSLATHWLFAAVSPLAAVQIGAMDAGGWKFALVSTYGGGSGLTLWCGGNAWVNIGAVANGASLSLTGWSGKSLSVDCDAGQIQIGLGMNLFVSGAATLTTTMSYTKPGGTTGTLTFTKGFLTNST